MIKKGRKFDECTEKKFLNDVLNGNSNYINSNYF